MALTIAGAHVAVSSLASGCYSVVKGINELRQSWKYMPMTLSSMVLACNTTSSTLKQVDLTLANYSGRLGNSYGELFDQFDGIKLGCAVTLSLLEKHVSDLLNIPNSGVPLKAQKTSATNKMKALYNESDMKELFRQLNVYITLLNTIQTHLQSDKQDKMMDMMASQEKTLESMFQAYDSLCKYLQTTDASLEHVSDTVSVLSSMTNMTASTANDFERVIKSTAVYQRCMKRRGDDNGLSSLGTLMAPLSQSGKIDNHDVEERVRDYEQSHGDRNTQGSMESGDDNDVKQFSSVPAIPRQAPVSLMDQPSVSQKPVRTWSVSSSLDSQSSNDELRPQHRPHTQYPDDPNQSAKASNRTGKSHPFLNQGFARPSGKPKPVSTQYNDDHIRGASRGDSREQHSPARSDDPNPIGATVSKTSVVTELSTLDEKRTNGTQTTMNLLYHRQKIDSMTVSSKLILAVKSNNMIHLWDLLAGKDVFRIPFEMTYRDTMSRVTFSPDGTLLAAVRSEGPDDKRRSTVSVWTSDIGVKLCKLDLWSDSSVIAIAISEDNQYVACSQKRFSHSDATVGKYVITTGHKLGEFPVLRGYGKSVQTLAFIQKDRQLICCSQGRVEIWDVAMYASIQVWNFAQRDLCGAVVTHDRMLVCAESHGLTMIDLRSGVIKACFSQLEAIRDWAYTPATKGIAFTGWDGSVGIWDPSTGRVLRLSSKDTDTQASGIPAVAIAPDGQAVFYGSVDGMVRVWYINN